MVHAHAGSESACMKLPAPPAEYARGDMPESYPDIRSIENASPPDESGELVDSIAGEKEKPRSGKQACGTCRNNCASK